MASQIRRVLSNRVVDALERCSFNAANVSTHHILPNIKVCEKHSSRYSFFLPWRDLQPHTNIDIAAKLSLRDTEDILLYVSENVKRDAPLETVGPHIDDIGEYSLGFNVNLPKLCRNILEPVLKEPNSIFKHSDRLQTKPLKILISVCTPVLGKMSDGEYFRSVVFGKFLSNLYTSLGHKVTTTCHVQDLGIEYGLFKHVCDSKQIDFDKIYNIDRLYDLYYSVQRQTTKDTTLKNLAYENLLQFHTIGKENNETWQLYNRMLHQNTREFHEKIRFSVDDYTFSSCFLNDQIDIVKNLLLEHDLLKISDSGKLKLNTPDGRLISSNEGLITKLGEIHSLLLHNQEHHNFDVNHILTDESQYEDYMVAVSTFNQLGDQFKDKIKPMSFGNIFTPEIKLNKSLTSYIEENNDILLKKNMDPAKHYRNCPIDCKEKNIESVMLSSLILWDLKYKSSFSYKHNFDDVTRVKDDTGTSLLVLYEHCCRLISSSEVNVEETNFDNCVRNPSALSLVLHIGRYDEVLQRCYEEVQSHYLIKYLFQLKPLIFELEKDKNNITIHEFELLIMATKNILGNALRIVGAEPLETI